MARNFNGSSDRIQVGIEYATVPISFSCWGYPTTLGVTQTFFGARNNSLNGSLQLRLETTNKLSILKANVSILLSSSGTVPGTNAWVHLAGSYDGTNVAVYINGVATTGTNNAGLGTVDTNTSFIGCGTDSGTNPLQFWNGRLADMTIFKFILTPLQVSALFAGIRPNHIGSATDTWWPLDGLQSPEPDIGQALLAKNGTLTGTAAAFGPPVAAITPRWPQEILPFDAGSTTSFRRTLSTLGTRVGARQRIAN